MSKMYSINNFIVKNTISILLISYLGLNKTWKVGMQQKWQECSLWFFIKLQIYKISILILMISIIIMLK